MNTMNKSQKKRLYSALDTYDVLSRDDASQEEVKMAGKHLELVFAEELVLDRKRVLGEVDNYIRRYSTPMKVLKGDTAIAVEKTFAHILGYINKLKSI